MKSQPSIAFQTNPMAITGFAVKTKKQKSGHVWYMTHDSLVPKMAPEYTSIINKKKRIYVNYSMIVKSKLFLSIMSNKLVSTSYN